MPASILPVSILIVLLFLAGCGSASTTDAPPPTTIPDQAPPEGTRPSVEIANAALDEGRELSVGSAQTIILLTSVRGEDLLYQWQLTGPGKLEKSGILRGVDGQTNRYTAPEVPVGDTTAAQVSVSVTDRYNRTAADQVAVRLTGPPSATLTVPGQETPTPRETVTPPANPAEGACVFNITHPENRSQVGGEVSVLGTATRECLNTGRVYWVTVAYDGLQWPQLTRLYPYPVSHADHLEWFATASIGVPLESGKTFGIFVVATDPAVAQEFETWHRDRANANYWPGLSFQELFDQGVEILNGVAVVRE